MITTRYKPNPFEAPQEAPTLVLWSEGMTVADVAPKGRGRLVAYRNGLAIEPSEWAEPAADGDDLLFVSVPSGEPLTTTALAEFVFKMALVSGLSYLISRKLGPAPPPLAAEDLNSNVYRFGGIRSNPDAANAPIPVVYGEHDVGGLEIVRYVAAFGFADEYNVLLLLSEGPVDAVGGLTEDADNLRSLDGNLPTGLKINGQPAGNFDDITCSVRVGNDEQEFIPGFESSITDASVDQTLTESNSPGPGNVEIPEGTYTPGVSADDSELDKWDTAVAYDMSAEADAVRLVLNAPNGLYTSNPSSPSLQANVVDIQARYIELDGGGSPTGDYVVLPPQQFSAATASALTQEYQFPFYDPATYQVASSGQAVSVTGATQTATLTGTADIANIFDATPAELTELSWVVVQSVTPNTTVGSDIRTRLDITNAAGDGIRLLLNLRAGTPGAQTQNTSTYALYQMNGGVADTAGPASEFLLLTEDPDFFGYKQWSLVYDFNPSTQQGRLRVYRNAALIRTIEGAAVTLPTTARPTITCVTNSASDSSIKLDDMRVFQRALAPSEIAALYNAGNFTYSSGGEPGVRLSLDFQTLPATNKAAAGGTLNNSGFTAGVAGVVPQQAGSLTNKRGKYRIEVQRLNAQDVDDLSQDRLDFERALLVTYDTFRYPGCALLALTIRATDQLNGGAPSVTVPVRGRKVPVWDGLNAQTPTFLPRWTSNPAWIAVDALLAEDYGLGDVHDAQRDIDVGAFQELADYCDRLVPKGLALVDLDDYTTCDLAYTAGTLGADGDVTITFDSPSVEQVAPNIQPGDFVAIAGLTGGVTATWNSADGEGYEVESVDFDPNGALTIEGKLPASFAAPTSVSGSISLDSPTLELREVRFRYDGVFDRPNNNGWDSVVSILQTCRAQPVRYGNRVSVIIEQPRPTQGLITMGNVLEGSFSTTYSSIQEQYNAVAIQILDRDDGYRQAIVEREHPTVTDPTNEESFRRRQIRMEGVTRQSQALREATYQLNLAQLLRRVVQFDLGRDALSLQAGDRISVAHDVPQWGFSGRLRAGLTASTVTLDREVTLESGSTYELSVESSTTGEIETQSVSTAAGTYAAGSTITVSTDFGFAPAQHDKYSLGVTNATVQDFTVTDVSLDPDTLVRTVQALQYDEQVFDDDFGVLLDSPSALQPPGPEDIIPSGPLNLSVTEGFDTNADGTGSAFIDVAWRNDPETQGFQSGVEIWLERESTGALTKVGTTTGLARAYRIQSAEITSGESYTVYARPRSQRGFARSVRAGASQSVEVKGFGPRPGAITNATASVAGPEISYSWTNPADNVATSVIARSGGWILGQRIFEAAEGSSQFGPTSAWIGPFAASGENSIPLFVRNQSATGMVGAAAQVSIGSAPPGVDAVGAKEFSSLSWVLSGQLTLSGMTIDSDNTLSLSSDSGYIEINVDVGGGDRPQWYWLQPFWEAEQVYEGLTWDDADFAWGSVKAQRWSWEGPIVLDPATDEAQGSVQVQIATTTDGTTPSADDLVDFSFGARYFRDALLRITFTKPGTKGNVKVSRGGYVAQQLQADNRRGQQFPSSPSDGELFYRTDLDDEFRYDSGRSKWLGTSLFEFTFLTISSGPTYFLFDDENLTSSATVGYVAPHDLCCVGLAGMDVVSTTSTRQVRDDGVGVASVAVTASSGPYRDMTLNSATIAAGSIVALYASSGISFASHHVAYFRRVAT